MSKENPYILLAEDDEDDMLFFISSLSGKLPHVIIKHVAHGNEAQEFLRDCPADTLPRLVLLDYKLPMLSGPEILRFLNTGDHFSSVMRIIWSAADADNAREECHSLGAEFFNKPITELEWEAFMTHIIACFD